MNVRHEPNKPLRGLGKHLLRGQICDALGIDGYGPSEEALVNDLQRKIERHCQRVARAAVGSYNARLAAAVAQGKRALEREPRALIAFTRFCGNVMGAMD
ncbi:hypothetical protein GCM10027021_35980 [Dyella kyungheensis]